MGLLAVIAPLDWRKECYVKHRRYATQKYYAKYIYKCPTDLMTISLCELQGVEAWTYPEEVKIKVWEF